MAQEDCKREFVRINNQFNVRIVANDKTARHGTREINTSRSINVSASGILINSNDRLDVGSVVDITFMKPHTFEFFKGSGRIVRVNEDTDKTYKIAINFMNLSTNDMQMLDYYIKLGGQ